MGKIHVTRQFFEASGPQLRVTFLKNNKKKPVYRYYGLGECLYLIQGLYRFWLVCTGPTWAQVAENKQK